MALTSKMGSLDTFGFHDALDDDGLGFDDGTPFDGEDTFNDINLLYKRGRLQSIDLSLAPRGRCLSHDFSLIPTEMTEELGEIDLIDVSMTELTGMMDLDMDLFDKSKPRSFSQDLSFEREILAPASQTKERKPCGKQRRYPNGIPEHILAKDNVTPSRWTNNPIFSSECGIDEAKPIYFKFKDAHKVNIAKPPSHISLSHKVKKAEDKKKGIHKAKSGRGKSNVSAAIAKAAVGDLGRKSSPSKGAKCAVSPVISKAKVNAASAAAVRNASFALSHGKIPVGKNQIAVSMKNSQVSSANMGTNKLSKIKANNKIAVTHNGIVNNANYKVSNGKAALKTAMKGTVKTNYNSTKIVSKSVMKSNGASSATKSTKTNVDKGKCIGGLTLEQRKLRIARFLEKRKRRVWKKKVKYRCRKKLADSRPRVKGRFVPRDVQNKVRAEQAEANKANAAMSNKNMSAKSGKVGMYVKQTRPAYTSAAYKKSGTQYRARSNIASTNKNAMAYNRAANGYSYAQSTVSSANKVQGKSIAVSAGNPNLLRSNMVNKKPMATYNKTVRPTISVKQNGVKGPMATKNMVRYNTQMVKPKSGQNIVQNANLKRMVVQNSTIAVNKNQANLTTNSAVIQRARVTTPTSTNKIQNSQVGGMSPALNNKVRTNVPKPLTGAPTTAVRHVVPGSTGIRVTPNVTKVSGNNARNTMKPNNANVVPQHTIVSNLPKPPTSVATK